MSSSFPLRPWIVALSLATCSIVALERMLDPALKLGTSTPKADPSGDYAFELFGRAEAVRPGARAALEANALRARRDFPELVSIEIPPELAVGAEYGITVVRGSPPAAWRLAWFILSVDGQAILAKHGFGAAR